MLSNTEHWLEYFCYVVIFWIHNASEKIRFVQHNLNNPNSLSTTEKKNSETDATKQKQRKQLILTDSKNIFTQRFQPAQRLQSNFITDGIDFMAQQKQLKQFILTDNQNISTYDFQQINAYNLIF